MLVEKGVSCRIRKSPPGEEIPGSLLSALCHKLFSKVLAMFDILCILIVLAFFAVGASFTRGCDKLLKEEPNV